VDWPGAGRHPAVLVTRQVAIPALSNVTVVLVTSTIRDLRTEVELGPEEGLDRICVANCDNVLTVPRGALGRLRGRLGPAKQRQLNQGLTVALGLDQPF
jgi:mRNA interferase MazF